MAGIRKVDNKVTIDGKGDPWGGNVIDLQYSVSFQGSSPLSVSVANDSGVYEDPDLDSTNPLLIEFGVCKMYMLPTSYRKSKGNAGRTLKVDFDDMGLKYLDKTVVLLKHQHLEEPKGGCTIVLGEKFANDVNGIQRRYYGKWKSGIVTMAYDIKDLADHIVSHGIPISSKFYEYLKQFKVYDKSEAEDCAVADAPNSFLRSDSGILRNVISQVANELGFVFFWNNSDGIEDKYQERVINEKPFEGFLDYIKFDKDIDKNRVDASIAKAEKACNVEDDSYEVSIKDSFMKGGIGFFDVTPNTETGRANRFKRYKFKETIVSPYTGNKVNIWRNYELSLLMQAALMGGEFYKNYVMQKLTAAYLRKLAASEKEGKNGTYLTLEKRNQGQGAVDNAFDLVDENSIPPEGAADFPVNIVQNSVVEELYLGDKFELLPCIYSLPYTTEESDWRDHAEIPLTIHAGQDPRWQDVIKDEGFTDSLRPAWKDPDNEETEIAASEFVGVAYTKTKEALSFMSDIESDPIFVELKFLAENYGRWYSMGGGNLITEQVYNNRTYSTDTSWIFSDLAATEGPLSDVYQFTFNRTDKDGESVEMDFEGGIYRIVKAGQSSCGHDMVSKCVKSPSSRTIDVPEDEAYQHIIGIYTLLHNSRHANAKAKRTGCLRGSTEEFIITNLYSVDSEEFGCFVTESLERRSDRELDDDEEDQELRGVIVGNTSGKSVTQAGYGTIQNERSNCDKAAEAFNRDGDEVTFRYEVDRDFGVVLHDAGRGTSVADNDGEMASSNYDKGNEVASDDLWQESGSAYFALEVIQYEPKMYPTEFGRKVIDYWDRQLVSSVTLAVPPKTVTNSKWLAYAFRMDNLLQSLRCSYIPDSKRCAEEFSKITSLEIEEVPFDIGTLLQEDNERYEFPICEDNSDEIDLPKAKKNLVKIMQQYVDTNASESVSRDLVISGFAFNLGTVCTPSYYLPSILEGLESMSILLNQNGVQTTVKMGNKRRMRASAKLRRSLIVKGLPSASASTQVPNPVNHSFSPQLQTRI